jgi:hypothetical protein
MIWAILELAKHPELQVGLREEIITEADANGVQRLTYASIRNAEHLDSFIREVMRTKGDTLSAVRHTTRDVKIGGYEIPSGQSIMLLEQARAFLTHTFRVIRHTNCHIITPQREISWRRCRRIHPRSLVGPRQTGSNGKPELLSFRIGALGLPRESPCGLG